MNEFTKIREFLSSKPNTVTRERILFHRFCYDLGIAAAHSEQHLTVLEPEIDRDGYDIVLEQEEWQRRVQLKSGLIRGGRSWKPKKYFVRPPIESTRTGVDPQLCGAGGAFILIELNTKSQTEPIRYWYSDFWIINVLRMGLLHAKSNPGSHVTPADDFIDDLLKGRYTDRITLSKRLFVRAKDCRCLLSLLELRADASNFRAPTRPFSPHVIDLVSADFTVQRASRDRARYAAIKGKASHVAKTLSELIDNLISAAL